MATLTALFTVISIQFSLPTNLLHSICFVETGHDVNAIHPNDGGSDSLGVCQVKLSTAKWLGFTGDEKQLMDPEHNIHYAAKYLSYHMTRYNGHVEKAVIAYNRGNATGLTTSAYQTKVFKQWRSN